MHISECSFIKLTICNVKFVPSQKIFQGHHNIENSRKKYVTLVNGGRFLFLPVVVRNIVTLFDIQIRLQPMRR